MSTDQDRPTAGHSKHHEHDRPNSAESPRELLAVHDPSKHSTGHDRQTVARGHGVTVQWVRPTELAARVAARGAAGAVAAHVAAHRQVRDSVRERLTRDADGSGRRVRLAPVSAFGRHGRAEQVTVERSVVGR
jgi:hypothetical protein